MVELFSDTFDDARYGIATVQPSRAVKKCRIRNLRVEYGLSKIAVFLVVPKACVNCEKQNVCSDDFAEQIIQKYNDHQKDSDEFMSFY